MKDFLKKNSVLKVISVVLAIILWYYVIIIVDPLVTKTFEDVPVIYTDNPSNDLAIIGGKESKVDVQIKATRKELAKIDKKNLQATVDCKRVTKEGSNSVKVTVAPYDDKVEPIYLDITAEKMATKTISVKENIRGDLVSGYAFDGDLNFVETIEIRGAKDYYVGRIKHAVVNVDVDGIKSDFDEEFSISFVDYNDKTIKNSDSIYENVEVRINSKETFVHTAEDFKLKVTCRVKKRQDVPIEVDLGSYEGMYEVVEITHKEMPLETVSVLLEKESNTIDKIRTKTVVIDDLSEDNPKVDVVLNVPSGAKLQDVETKSVTVELKKKEMQEETSGEESNS